MLLMVVMFGVFWFMLIRPQQKRQREHQDMLKNLKKGDQVVTSGGVIGKISGLTATEVVLEIQEKVRMKLQRSAIQGKYQPSEAPAPAADAKDNNTAKA
jgi:preprotein translocase subunit YajC